MRVGKNYTVIVALINTFYFFCFLLTMNMSFAQSPNTTNAVGSGDFGKKELSEQQSVKTVSSKVSFETMDYSNIQSPIGMNTSVVTSSNASLPFVDIFRNSTPFEESRPWLTKGNIIYDKSGWPTKLNGGQVGSRFINKLPAGTIPDGNYIVLYDGVGNLQYGNDAKLVSKTPGREIISIKAGADEELRATLLITKTHNTNPIRNIRILMPGGICSNNPYRRVQLVSSCRDSEYLSFEKHSLSIIFNPEYLKYMKNFKILRFTNMSGITNNPISEWARRPVVTQSTWGGKQSARGAPLEIMVELANRNNSDAWFSLPHAANDLYLRKFAQYVRDNLKPGLKVYIEYTNKAWNTDFDQANYIQSMGMKLGLDDAPEKAGYKYYSFRSVQMFSIFEQEFRGTERLVRVMSGSTGYTRLTEMLLGYRDAYKNTDAFAIDPFFYVSTEKQKKVSSVNEIFEMLYDEKLPFSIPSVEKRIAKQAKLAKSYGVSLIAYEGGLRLPDRNNRDIAREVSTKHYFAANRDWRMAKAYTDFIGNWRRAGGEVFVSFSANRTHKSDDYLTQPDHEAPKLEALLTFIKNNRCWWRGCSSTQITRLEKPHRNPNPIIFSQIPSKPTKPTKPTKPITPRVAQANRPNINKSFKNTEIKSTKFRAPKLGTPKSPTLKTAPKPKFQPIYSPAPIPQSPSVLGDVESDRYLSHLRLVPLEPGLNQHYDGIVLGRKYGTGWKRHQQYRIMNVIGGDIKGRDDLVASFKTSWDANYLNIRVITMDDRLVKDSITPWSDDSIEILVDADGSRNSEFDRMNDFHFIFRWRDQTVNVSQRSPRRGILGIRYDLNRHTKGYTLNASIPWRTLGVIPQNGSIIGIDVQINDDDNGNERDGKLAWFSKNDKAWHNPQNFGRMILLH